MIRVQIVCYECKQIVDTTVYAKSATVIAEAFSKLHTLDACRKEEPADGGQDQAGAGGGAEGQPAAAPPGDEAKSRPH